MLSPPRTERHARGTTLVEVLLVLCIAALFAGIAYPSFSEQQRRTWRSEAVTRLAQVQQMQERFRANQPRYASLDELGLPAPGERYRIEVDDIGPAGYTARARAQGRQAADARCRVLQLSAVRGTLLQASGADDALDNDAGANARCWLQ